MLHILPCLTIFNIVGYIKKSELNKWMWCFFNMQLVAYWAPFICSVVCCTLPCHASLNWTCIILGCASCHDYVMVVYYVVCFFPVLLLIDSSGYIAIVRSHLTMPVRLLHGFGLLTSGISGKMTIPSKSLLSLLASCSLFCYVAIPTTSLSCLPYC